MAPSPVSLGGDTAHHAGMQSVLAAAMGLTSLGASISPSSSSSSPTTNMASMESNRSENHPAASASSALAAPSPPIFKKSPAGFGNLQAPFAHSSKDATVSMDQFSGTGQIAGMNSAAIDAPSPGPASCSQDSEAPLPIPASLSKLPVREKSFPETLLEVLSSEEHSDAIAWLPHGRGFVVLDKEVFASRVLPRYFDGSKYSSFTRRMKRWGFDRVPRGPEMGAYYHRGFLRDRPELVREMTYGAGEKREGGEKRKTGKEGAAKLRTLVNKAVVKKLVEEAVERQVQISLSEKGPVQLNSEADINVLQSQAEHSTPRVLSEHIPIDTWLAANPSPQDQGHSIPLPSASPAQLRIEEIERELFLTRSMLSRNVADQLAPGWGATAASARARSSANGSISNRRPYGAPTCDVQRMIDVDRATHALEAESIAEFCIRRSEALMASNVLASSKIHANVMDGGSCAETNHARRAAAARKNPDWLEDQADLLRPSFFPLRIPDSGAPIDLREERIAEIQRELLLTQSMLPPRKGADYLTPGLGATAASARARLSANGSIFNRRPYCA